MKGFEGRLRYGYQQAPESDCSPLLGVQGGFETLPCTLGYELDAKRIEAPKTSDAQQ